MLAMMSRIRAGRVDDPENKVPDVSSSPSGGAGGADGADGGAVDFVLLAAAAGRAAGRGVAAVARAAGERAAGPGCSARRGSWSSRSAAGTSCRP